MITERAFMANAFGLDRWVNTRVVVIDWLITELLAAGLMISAGGNLLLPTLSERRNEGLVPAL